MKFDDNQALASNVIYFVVREEYSQVLDLESRNGALWKSSLPGNCFAEGDSHAGNRDPGHGGAGRQHPRAHPHRQGIPRPQRAARLQVQDLHLRPEARGDACDQAPIAPQVSRRARDRSSQSRAPYGPQLSLVPSGRCCQRRPRRRRLQLPPPDPLAQAFVVPNPRPCNRRASARSSLKAAFFTEDDLATDFASNGCQTVRRMSQLRTICRSISRCNAERVPFRAGPPFLKFPMHRLQKSPGKLRRCCSATSTRVSMGMTEPSATLCPHRPHGDTYGDPWTRVAELVTRGGAWTHRSHRLTAANEGRVRPIPLTYNKDPTPAQSKTPSGFPPGALLGR